VNNSGRRFSKLLLEELNAGELANLVWSVFDGIAPNTGSLRANQAATGNASMMSSGIKYRFFNSVENPVSLGIVVRLRFEKC